MTATRASRPGRFRRSEAGFTLIEVMIAVLVLSIGLLGLAGLQVTALQNNQSSFTRSQATALAYDLADRMRANVPGVMAGFYDPAAPAINAGCLNPGGCSVQAMARHDLAEWNAAIASNLPMGTGTACVDSTPGDGASEAAPECDGVGTQYTVKIWWDDNKDGVITVTPTNMERLEISFNL